MWFSIENASHFLFTCLNYVDIRHNLIDIVTNFCDAAVDTLLYGNSSLSYGNNVAIFDAVHRFIIDSERFD